MIVVAKLSGQDEVRGIAEWVKELSPHPVSLRKTPLSESERGLGGEAGYTLNPQKLLDQGRRQY